MAVGASEGWYGAGHRRRSRWSCWPGPTALRFEGPAPADVSPLAFLGNVAGGTVIAQSVLTGGPVVLSLVGGTRAEVTSLFTALALFRAPYIVALGLAIRVTAHLTDLAAAGTVGTPSTGSAAARRWPASGSWRWAAPAPPPWGRGSCS